MTNYSSTFLLPKNSFWIGAGSVLNIAGNYMEFNVSDSPEEADSRALENDFGVVGNDIKDSMNNFSNNLNENVQK